MTQSAEHPPDRAIDWGSIAEEIHCQACAYNLRGIDRPRCPECGLVLTWDELLDPEKRPHRLLYEHHDGTDRKRRFRKTVLGALRPLKFWRSMRITRMRRGGPFRRYVGWTQLVLTVECMLLAVGAVVSGSPLIRNPPGQIRVDLLPPGVKPTANWTDLDAVLDLVEKLLLVTVETVISLLTVNVALRGLALAAGVLTLFWSIFPLTVLGLWLFSLSRKHLKVSSGHYWRLVLYPAASNSIALLLGLTACQFVKAAVQPGDEILILVIYGLIGASVLHWWGSLIVGAKVYLGWPRSWLAVAASQFVVFSALGLIWAILFLAVTA